MAASGSKSKKRSGANSGSKPPEAPIFFLDRSLGKKRIATALRQAGAAVHVHDDYFPPNAKDEACLPRVGQEGRIVLTKDHRIRYRHLERAAMMKAKKLAWKARYAAAAKGYYLIAIDELRERTEAGMDCLVGQQS